MNEGTREESLDWMLRNGRKGDVQRSDLSYSHTVEFSCGQCIEGAVRVPTLGDAILLAVMLNGRASGLDEHARTN